MYSSQAHAVLQRIITTLSDTLGRKQLQPFYTRLGIHFPELYSRYCSLYGQRVDLEAQLTQLVQALLASYLERSNTLKQLDLEREQNPQWFLSQQWVGMALYADRFAGGLAGVTSKVGYLQQLGVNMIHIMPLMQCPLGSNDGGYAVSDFRKVDRRIGTQDQLNQLTSTLRREKMLLTLDVVINHTSDEHEWAERARQGDKTYQDYYYCYPDRKIPDQFERTLPEIFPETAPGSFTWNEALQQWVMTVFNNYQWDLNYTNPAVFREMTSIILHWANQGADILRLDAPAFIWKQIGTTSQNLPQAHTLLQLFKACAQIVSPGVLFIAEAIVAPHEIMKYFGTPSTQECDIAYNATFMALLWDAVATRNTKVLTNTLKHLPIKPMGTTWLNYVRCHDDIGLGFSDEDIVRAGFNPLPHRRYLLDYLTGQYPNSIARGAPFGSNPKTGDARISGSLASLAGLEAALESNDPVAIEQAQNLIITLHALMMSYGGIALLYYGDELATLNDHDYLNDPTKASDNRWMHRPQLQWERIQQLLTTANPQQAVFSALQHLIALRKQLPILADLNNRVLVDQDNDHLLVFACKDLSGTQAPLFIVANFDDRAHHFNLNYLAQHGWKGEALYDLYSQQALQLINKHLISVPAKGFYWLSNQLS